jgi:hypothetical protein
MEHTSLNGDRERHYPGCVNVSFAYVEGESLLMALKDIALIRQRLHIGVPRTQLRSASTRQQR